MCPNNGTDEIYLISNPPYVGSSMQTAEQKAEIQELEDHPGLSKNLDYISIWFIKGSDYIRATNSQLAFVSTNPVSQGDHVSILFPIVLADGIEIGFAYTSFKWENSAKYNAGVTVIAIGLRKKSHAPKFLFQDDIQRCAANINAYLTDGPDLIISRRGRPLSGQLPPILFGSKPTDGGNWLFTI